MLSRFLRLGSGAALEPLGLEEEGRACIGARNPNPRDKDFNLLCSRGSSAMSKFKFDIKFYSLYKYMFIFKF